MNLGFSRAPGTLNHKPDVAMARSGFDFLKGAYGARRDSSGDGNGLERSCGGKQELHRDGRSMTMLLAKIRWG